MAPGRSASGMSKFHAWVGLCVGEPADASTTTPAASRSPGCCHSTLAASDAPLRVEASSLEMEIADIALDRELGRSIISAVASNVFRTKPTGARLALLAAPRSSDEAFVCHGPCPEPPTAASPEPGRGEALWPLGPASWRLPVLPKLSGSKRSPRLRLLADEVAPPPLPKRSRSSRGAPPCRGPAALKMFMREAMEAAKELACCGRRRPPHAPLSDSAHAHGRRAAR
mmetsp:Transcript_63343/g.182255  ORF Transcript_63343/g.182255 Transcript_63343/m.182255 type:complete len:227 (-) Transcript_63343:34-714(-)